MSAAALGPVGRASAPAPSPRRRLRTRGRRGAALIEFALLAPVLIGLLIGVLDAGWIFWQNAAMQVAVQDGCRDGAITDAGQDRVFLADIQRSTRTSVVERLEGLGVACDDCEVAVDAVDVNGLLMLSCSMDRSAQSVAGLFEDMDLTTTTLTQMEVQR